ncbi:MAG: glutaredoxin 3 [Gammaproteobacteria bacterium]|nr:glutaredoxin 3 [Gammaproteobacteria bacterium]MDE2023333.1 glutaredoxin 3 [Gammaproteobacteria bacterium]MDE2274276.1 glutaredoxin 3 [Gammaproteobacteria bacterium]
MQPVTVYSTRVCPYCMRAKALLQSRHIAYTEYLVDQEPARRVEMQQKSGGRRSVPQIFIGDRHVGGCDELYALERRGELDRLLAG